MKRLKNFFREPLVHFHNLAGHRRIEETIWQFDLL